MSAPLATLEALAVRCEQATGPVVVLDDAIAKLIHELDGRMWSGLRPYTASLDAAMSLVPEGWRWVMREACPDELNPTEQGFFARLETHDYKTVTWGRGSDWITDHIAGREVFCWAATPALALCAAALRACAVGEAE